MRRKARCVKSRGNKSQRQKRKTSAKPAPRGGRGDEGIQGIAGAAGRGDPQRRSRPPGPRRATPAPAWSIQSLSTPTNFVPGDESGRANYQTYITNSGGKVTDQSPITITDTLPAGLEVSGVRLSSTRPA